MTTNLNETLQGVVAKLQLDGAGGVVFVDFSGVQRIDPGTLKALDHLAEAAQEKAAKVVLEGVSIDVYKVLKLMKLERRFSFQT